MSIFFKRLVQFTIIPVLILIVILIFYVKRDVYLDFGPYQNYSWKYVYQSLGDVSTKKLLHATTPYNSFIMGSSRTTGLYACYLQRKIAHSRFFHYGNWDESVGGIYAKLKLLDSLGYSIDNLFIYIDTDFTFANDGKCINDHYLLTGKNKFKYYFDHYRGFVPPPFDPDRFKVLVGKKVTAVFPNWESDRITNDSWHTCNDSVINNYRNTNFTKAYVHKIDSLIKVGFLNQRSKNQKFREKQISPAEEAMLIKIEQLLQKHKTKYYVVITPLYDQLKFNAADLQIIKEVFKNNVYDFSGINKITGNAYNYADKEHFAPYISKMIADSIFAHPQGKMFNL